MGKYACRCGTVYKSRSATVVSCRECDARVPAMVIHKVSEPKRVERRRCGAEYCTNTPQRDLAYCTSCYQKRLADYERNIDSIIDQHGARF